MRSTGHGSEIPETAEKVNFEKILLNLTKDSMLRHKFHPTGKMSALNGATQPAGTQGRLVFQSELVHPALEQQVSLTSTLIALHRMTFSNFETSFAGVEILRMDGGSRTDNCERVNAWKKKKKGTWQLDSHHVLIKSASEVMMMVIVMATITPSCDLSTSKRGESGCT